MSFQKLEKNLAEATQSKPPCTAFSLKKLERLAYAHQNKNWQETAHKEINFLKAPPGRVVQSPIKLTQD